MALADLLNRPITIIRRTTTGTVDLYGNEQPGETVIETVGELQSVAIRRSNEPNLMGELSDTQYVLFLPAGTLLDTGDAIICDGQTYELVGDPFEWRNPRTQTTSHVECALRRTAGAEDEGS